MGCYRQKIRDSILVGNERYRKPAQWPLPDVAEMIQQLGVVALMRDKRQRDVFPHTEKGQLIFATKKVNICLKSTSFSFPPIYLTGAHCTLLKEFSHLCRLTSEV